MHLRDLSPERTYREILRLTPLLGQPGFAPALELVKHRTELLKVAQSKVEIALIWARFVNEGQPGFFELAFGLFDLFPTSMELSDALVAAALRRAPGPFGHIVEMEHEMAELKARIADPATPARFIPWLNRIAARIRGAASEQQQLLRRIEYDRSQRD